MSVPAPPALLGPYTWEDLQPVPDAWRIGPPDFVGAGAGKCGTTWWWSLLAEHPRFVPNRLQRKELHYFPHFGWKTPSEDELVLYRASFARPAGSVCGEWSGNYLYYPFALEALAQAAPETKLILLLRNPVDRFISLLNQYALGRSRIIGAEGAGARVLETWSLFPEAAYQARVADGLERAIGLFGRERLLVLQYERCRENPAEQWQRTAAYLGIDTQFQPTGLTRPVHRQEYVVARPSPKERATIAAWFQPDVERTFALLPGLERALWPDF